MSINNSFTAERIKRALSLRTVAIVCLIVTALSVLFYTTAEKMDSKEVIIWLVTTDSEAELSNEAIKNINEYGAGLGIEKVLVTRRHPEDRYFEVTMSTSAFYTCDIFIMQKDIALEYAEMDMFLQLSEGSIEGDDLLCVGDAKIGVLIENDHYFLINKKTDIDQEIIYNIYKMLEFK